MSQDAVLAELGIIRWLPRAGVRFPGAPVSDGEAGDTGVKDEAVGVSGSRLLTAAAPRASQPAPRDLCFQVDATTAEEQALLEGIIKATVGLREGVRVGFCMLSDSAAALHVLRLDGKALPTLAAMIANPSLKRPLWEAIKAAVARLP